MIIKQGANENLYYTFTDHLGSVMSLLNTDGSVAEKYSYDAWGRRRNPITWTYDSIPAPILIDRGFTGLEHLEEFGLINMNGRMYDPALGRFLSVDPYIQFPESAQSYNGYGYCGNNPLKYTDPSGMLLMPGDFDNSLFDISNNWMEDFDENHSFNFGGGSSGKGRNGKGLSGIYYDWSSKRYRDVKTNQIVSRAFVNVIIGANISPDANVSIWNLGPGQPAILIVQEDNTEYGEGNSKERLRLFVFGKMYKDYNIVQTVEFDNVKPFVDGSPIVNGFYWSVMAKNEYQNDYYRRGADFYWFDNPNAKSYFIAESTLCGKTSFGWHQLASFTWGYTVENGKISDYFKINIKPTEYHQNTVNSTLIY